MVAGGPYSGVDYTVTRAHGQIGSDERSLVMIEIPPYLLEPVVESTCDCCSSKTTNRYKGIYRCDWCRQQYRAIYKMLYSFTRARYLHDEGLSSGGLPKDIRDIIKQEALERCRYEADKHRRNHERSVEEAVDNAGKMGPPT